MCDTPAPACSEARELNLVLLALYIAFVARELNLVLFAL